MTNEKLGVATEPSSESLWGVLHLWIGGLYICALGFDILKFQQTSLFYTVVQISIWGDLELCFRGAKPTKGSTGLCDKTSACFFMQLILKST